MWYSKPERLFSQKLDRIKSQLSTMADLVREGGCVDEGELLVLEKSGVLASPKLKGKAKARSTNRPKHIVFVEEGEEGSSCLVSCRTHVGKLSRPGTYEGPSNSVPATETTPDDDGSDIDLGWKPEARQKRKKGKQKSQGQDESDLQLLEEESKVWCIPRPFDGLTDPKLLRPETSTAAGSGAFSSDGAGPTATVCRARAGDAEIVDGERSDEEAEGSRGGEG